MERQLITRKAVNQVISDYVQQYKKYPWYLAYSLIFPATANILIFFVPPLIVGKLVDLFIKKGVISLSLASNYILLFGGLWILGEVFWRIGMHYIIKIEALGMNNLARNAFDKLLERDYNFYANHFVGSLSKKGASYSRNFEPFTDTISFNIFSNFVPLVFVLIVLWGYSPWLPLILASCLALVIAAAIPIIKKRSTLVAKRHDANSRLVGRLSDSLTNMLAVKSFAKEKQEYDVFGKYVDDWTEKFRLAANFHNIHFDTVISPFYVGTNVIGLIAVIFFAQRLNLQAGAIVVVFSYYAQITRIFWEINHVYRTLESSVSEAAEFAQMFVDPPEVEDAEDAGYLKVTKAEINFNNVNFGYTDGKETNSFLKNFNLKIESNQRIGLVGPSGGGKTTITKLLIRFIDLQAGSITIDGQDICKVTQNSLRENMAFVPQEPLLFHRTLLENIAYGNEKASEEDIVQAAKIAHADEFIKLLPKGYKTLVGERGIKLSGGQRQRVAIARALLKKAPILVLDEATSALDSESEKYIQEGLWELMKGKTALVIAHRLSTVKHLDRIIVLDQGKIVQDGTHTELIKQKGLYAKLWSHQSGSSEASCLTLAKEETE